MKIRILLIRHVESLKNTLNACSSLDGKEPVTKYGHYQSRTIAKYIAERFRSYPASDVSVYCANDNRSKITAATIAEALKTDFTITDQLSSFTNSSTSGKINDDIFRENRDFEKKLKLYRAGLISASEVPWPTGETALFQEKLERFADDIQLYSRPWSVIVGHKSSLTCLAFIILRHFDRYPNEFYGYVDIPPGKGILIEISANQLDMELLDFGVERKGQASDVVIKDGRIVFPGSACAVCWRDKKLLLVQQHRYGQYSWEVPGGKIEPRESPIDAAGRELVEETGYSGKEGKLLYKVDLDLSISENKTYLVEFEALTEKCSGDHVAKWFSLEELDKMIQQAEITHVQTILAYLLKRNEAIC